MLDKPECAWQLSDLDSVPQNGIKVMSTFACGGGSTMGYKLAGCDVVAANDIDPNMAYHYKLNLHPKLYYLCPIRDLLTAELPDQLFNLDILDGSPPCSTFSMAGNREKDWGKNKKFAEGQAEQVLSDLFFDYLDLVERLKPKVVIAENVKGMLIGNAKGYTKLIMERLSEIGYRPQLFLVNATDCGVPQRRERIFFCALRNDIERPRLELNPKHRWISVGEATSDIQDITDNEVAETKMAPYDRKWWYVTKPGEQYIKSVVAIEGGVGKLFNHVRLDQHKPSCTITSGADKYKHWSQFRRLTFREYKRIGAFPDDYVAKTARIGCYIVGMSVPPRMTQYVAEQVIQQWLQ